jgi:hypothetical protein
MEQQSTKPQKKRGCFFYGCLTFSILVVIAIVFAGTGLYFGYKNVSSTLTEIADSEPVRVNTESYSEEEVQTTMEKIGRFLEATKADRPVEPLVLSAREINSLIQTEEGLAPFRDRVKVDFEGDRVKALISTPLTIFNMPDKYLNGQASVRIGQGKKGVELYLEEIRVKDRTLPSAIMALLREKDLVEELRKDAENQEFLEHLDRIQLQNGKLIIYGKGAST